MHSLWPLRPLHHRGTKAWHNRCCLGNSSVLRVSPSRTVCDTSMVQAELNGRHRTIALFDVDGTLTVPRKGADPTTLAFLQELREYVKVGIVGGSDEIKICEQLGGKIKDEVDFFFAENGLVAYKEGKVVAIQSLKTWLGEDKLKMLLNFILHYIADLDIPIKRGTFIEFRNGMLNVSPIGRNCSQEERDEFEKFDHGAGVRKKFVGILRDKFAHLGLTYSIGGQISFDIFPQGWDKTYCLQYVESEYDEIHFFGDKTFEGGNDYEIFASSKTIGHTVNSPMDTIGQCKELFMTPQQATLHGTASQ